MDARLDNYRVKNFLHPATVTTEETRKMNVETQRQGLRSRLAGSPVEFPVRYVCHNSDLEDSAVTANK